MKIIISPAMKMQVNREAFPVRSTPQFLPQAQELVDFLKQCNLKQLQAIWQGSERTTKEGAQQIANLNLAQTQNLTPAVISYSGIQYQYMAADLFTVPALDYLQDNVRILSGLYGVLRPFDGVWPYRLEMKNKVQGFKQPNLYKFWGSIIADNLFNEETILINLASKEYSKNITPYLTGERRMISIDFQELKNDQWRTVGVHAKMARGEMTRFIAEKQLTNPEELQTFSDFGFHFIPAASTADTYVFRTKFDFKRR
ncbi:peroxide stress protein YaaA [Lactobacillus sp. ESL0785]|uniref:peroxide stress protein YaaA n=1 Tax=Lactobacillus sp. ESL0785 TaxID=2983232 RepID=UPI0023F693ED|nr:peroxide stress protein YaaA [Lactobacillus sp. ESL0785]WEV71084.1 peroxide stress protein YaaA [Lactobacillus sp. ESL0785]